jgi:hypothetical protein
VPEGTSSLMLRLGRVAHHKRGTIQITVHTTHYTSVVVCSVQWRAHPGAEEVEGDQEVEDGLA